MLFSGLCPISTTTSLLLNCREVMKPQWQNADKTHCASLIHLQECPNCVFTQSKTLHLKFKGNANSLVAKMIILVIFTNWFYSSNVIVLWKPQGMEDILWHKKWCDVLQQRYTLSYMSFCCSLINVKLYSKLDFIAKWMLNNAGY